MALPPETFVLRDSLRVHSCHDDSIPRVAKPDCGRQAQSRYDDVKDPAILATKARDGEMAPKGFGSDAELQVTAEL